MSYNVTVWSNTGFNVNNIPDTPALLGQGTSVQAIEIMQERYLNSIKISSEWSAVKNVDYCKVGDMYYIVTGVNMLATDVAELALVPDFISSLGGVSQLTILDGITERCHLPNSVDGDKDDPLLAPHDSLELEYEVLHSAIESFGNSSKFTVIETTADLSRTMCYPAVVTYKKGLLTDDKVEVPRQYGLTKAMKTEFVSPMVVGTGAFQQNPVNKRDTVLELVDTNTDLTRMAAGGQVTTNIPDQNGDTHKMGITEFKVDQNGDAFSLLDYNAEYLSVLNGAGIQNAIVNKIEYPFGKVYVQECYYRADLNQFDSAYPDAVDTLTEIEKQTALPHLSIKRLKGIDETQNSTIKFKYTNAKNDILDFSDFTPYGLLTASGNKLETQPKSLVSNLHSVSASAAPVVRCMTDPNPDGAPYYAFNNYMGDSSLLGFMARNVKGMSWKQVPLVFSEKSGWLTDAISQRTTEKVISEQYMNSQALLVANSAVAAGFGGMEKVNYTSQAAGLPTGAYIYSRANGYMGRALEYNSPEFWKNSNFGTSQIMGMGMPIVNGISQAIYNDWNYRNTMYENGMKYALSQIASPTLAFPYNSEPARLATDNGVITYRMKYSAGDIARIDKLITMYGVKTTRPLESSMFTSRRYFNYIACNDVTLTGHSRWMDEGAALQLKGGVRIWHVKPDPAKYLTENI